MPALEHPDIDGSDYSKLLAGHLGHLTSSQEKSLETFKQSLHKACLYDPKADDGGRPSHDDTTLLCVHNQPSISGFVDVLDTAGSFAPGSSMSIKRTSSSRKPPAGGRSTMWRVCMRHLTPKRWSPRRGSILGGPADEIRYRNLAASS